MDKNAVLGEILFIISMYEKGRVKKASQFWSRKYIKSIYDSIIIMKTLICLIEKDQDVSFGEMLPVLKFVNNNVGKIFSERIDTSAIYSDRARAVLEYDNTKSRDDKELIALMNKILIECEKILENRSSNYKQQIIYLLMAFHNLPKAYLDPSKTTFFNIGIRGISKSNAIADAYAYIEIMNKLVT